MSNSILTLKVSKLYQLREIYKCSIHCVGLCVCVWVGVCVHSYSSTTGYGAAYERYKRLQNNKILKNKRTIFQKHSHLICSFTVTMFPCPLPDKKFRIDFLAMALSIDQQSFVLLDNNVALLFHLTHLRKHSDSECQYALSSHEQ